MPFALVIIGLVLIVTGAKDTYREFGAELVEDFTGPGNFTYWIVSIGAVGALGYVPALRGISRAFLALIVLSMVLSNRGVFAKLTQALQAGPEHVTATPRPTTGGMAGVTASTLASAPSTTTAQNNFAFVVKTAMSLFNPVGA